MIRRKNQLTCIFKATSVPSSNLAQCTWPIEAAAKGFGSNSENMLLHSGPNSFNNTF